MITRYIALGILLFTLGCSSGKRSFERGDYDQAVYTAVNRLQKDPDNSKALQTLKQAYRYADEGHQLNIKELSVSADPLRWEGVMREYEALNRLSDAIQRCPSCRQAVGSQQKYTAQLTEARGKAAEVRYARGLQLLKEKNRQSAKLAYADFQRAEALSPGLKDVRQKIEEAYWAAVLKVVVEPVEVRRGVYELSNEYFQNKIFEYLQGYEQASFIKFYTPKQVRNQKFVPDQVLTLSFDDFVVGQTYLKEKETEVKRDSVKISAPKEKDVYATVKAQYITFEKTITSTGLLDFRVMDWTTKNIITQEKMPGTFIWHDEWATYRGDDRALTDVHKKLVNRKESPNPAPQFLFVEFTKPIYEQLTDKIQSFYRRY
jgi:hypothetical protein